MTVLKTIAGGGGAMKGTSRQNTDLVIRKKHVDLDINWQEETTGRNTNNIHELDYFPTGFARLNSTVKKVGTHKATELNGSANTYTA
jgi:hypothetical protein